MLGLPAIRFASLSQMLINGFFSSAGGEKLGLALRHPGTEFGQVQ